VPPTADPVAPDGFGIIGIAGHAPRDSRLIAGDERTYMISACTTNAGPLARDTSLNRSSRRQKALTSPSHIPTTFYHFLPPPCPSYSKVFRDIPSLSKLLSDKNNSNQMNTMRPGNQRSTPLSKNCSSRGNETHLFPVPSSRLKTLDSELWTSQPAMPLPSASVQFRPHPSANPPP